MAKRFTIVIETERLVLEENGEIILRGARLKRIEEKEEQAPPTPSATGQPQQ
jgi:hypothetical protein